MLKHFLGTIILIQTLSSNNTSPYIGGNQFGSFYTNPNLINSFLTQINSTISPACNEIKGIGLPILAIKQVLQTIDNYYHTTTQILTPRLYFSKRRKVQQHIRQFTRWLFI